MSLLYLKHMKIKIYVFLFFFAASFYALGEEKISAREEDDITKIRYIRYGRLYSFAFTQACNIFLNTYQYGFSFNSDRIKAGRIKPSGIWQELLNPFSYGADSPVYRHITGAEKNFENNTGGVNGISMELPFDTSFIWILQPVMWAGSITNVKLSDYFSLHVLFRADEQSTDASAVWRNEYSDITISEPFYSGIEMQTVFRLLRMKTLLFLSGNPYFRSGFLFRNILTFSFLQWELGVLVLYADKDFMLPSGKLEDGRFLSSGIVKYFPFEGLAIIINGEYRVDKEPAYPALFTGSRYYGDICAQIGKSTFIFTVKGSDTTAFKLSGVSDSHYSVESSIKAGKEYLFGKLLFVETGGEGKPFRRRGTLELNAKTPVFSLKTTASLIQDAHTSPLYHFEGGVTAVLYTPKAVFTCSFRKSMYTGETHYYIGFDTTI